VIKIFVKIASKPQKKASKKFKEPQKIIKQKQKYLNSLKSISKGIPN
jgi:hypothetical protein